MESNGSYWTEDAESILDQLLKFAAQLAEFENDPLVDIKSLSDQCAKRIDELKRLIPDNFKNSAAAGGEVLAKMRTLYERTQVCVDMLQRKSDAVSSSLQRLSKTKQAVNAYSHGRNFRR